MTKQERLDLLETTMDAIDGIFSKIAFECQDDDETLEALSDIERNLSILKRSLEEGEYDESVNYYEYLVYDFDEEQEIRVHKPYAPEDANKMLEDASKTICFSDCSDERVSKIVYRGREVQYAGWQPGMVYQFIDANGKVVYTTVHEEWEH